jgi:hypothetical protein
MTEERDTELQQAPPAEVVPTVPQLSRNQTIAVTQDPEEMVAMIQRGAAAQSKIVAWALKQTDSSHWDNMGGRPRLNKVGAHHVARLTGLKVRTLGATLIDAGQDDAGPYFVYQCMGEISSVWSPSVISCQGTCDSRNQFHTTRYEEKRDANGNLMMETKTFHRRDGSGSFTKQVPIKERIQLQASQVQKSFIMQQAQTLCKVKGITEYLGLERLEWRDVEVATKAREEESTSVDYGNAGKSAEKPKQDPKKAPPPERKPTDLATGAERQAVWAGYCAMMKWDPDSLPAGAGEAFYAWVEEVAEGPEHRDKSKWTKAIADILLAATKPKQ